ncbi:MAG TPA: putative basic amino acid antiporter YfcC [Acidobacteria bacterium]|nr:putative basic amino acid antiporter YfcC [Acidobacteriota bacterium]
MKRKSFKLPHTLVLIYWLVILVYLLALILPSGEFQRTEKTVQGQARLMTVPGTYHQVEKKWLGPEWLLIAPIRGFEDASLIIILIFIFGGTFGILTKSGAIDAGIHRLAAFFGQKPGLRVMVIPVLMLIFSLAGSVYGMAEESIPFVLIFIPFALSLGYDSIVGVAIPFLGSAVGFAAAFFNPFTVGIAQGLAELPLYSGLGYRLILWLIMTAVAIGFVMIYAEKIRKNPSLSPVYELDRGRLVQQDNSTREPEWGTTGKMIIATLFAGIGLLIYGILARGWYMEEIAAVFLGIGLVAGLVARMKPSAIALNFLDGAKDMMNVSLIIACGRAILIILREAAVLDTMLQGAANVIAGVPSVLTAQVIFLVQAVINFFVHSGTAQAALTMPIIAPLSDLVGLTRQTSVLAFQLCEVINPVLPTSAVTMGVLGVAKIPWEKWARWFLPLMLILSVLSLLALIPPVLIKWGPF